jgi:hypothetical protein
MFCWQLYQDVLMFSGRVGSSCSSSDTHCVTIEQIYHVWEGYLRKILVWRRKISRAERRGKFSLKTGIAKTYITFLPSRASNRQIHSEYFCFTFIRKVTWLIKFETRCKRKTVKKKMSFILNMFLFRKHLKSFQYCVFIHLNLRCLSGRRICLHWIPGEKVVRQTEILIV